MVEMEIFMELPLPNPALFTSKPDSGLSIVGPNRNAFAYYRDTTYSLPYAIFEVLLTTQLQAYQVQDTQNLT